MKVITVKLDEAETTTTVFADMQSRKSGLVCFRSVDVGGRLGRDDKGWWFENDATDASDGWHRSIQAAIANEARLLGMTGTLRIEIATEY
jgi:hypothetical protein